MIGSFLFQICSLFYIVMLIYIYFSKKRISLLENSIYICLMIFDALLLIVDIISVSLIYNMDKFPTLNIFFGKLFLVMLVIWLTILSSYVFTISCTDKEKPNIVCWQTIFFGTIIGLITIILIYIYPLNFVNGGSYVYSHGPAAMITYVFSGTMIITWIVRILLRMKYVKKKKFTPILLYIIMTLIGAAIQFNYPDLLVVSFASSFVTVLMYFTIENPDMKMIAELNEARDQAEKANNAKSDFLSSMSHEIRTPLNAIVGFSQALAEEDLPQTAKEEVKDIVSASESLLDLVNGILDISKIEANKLEIVDKEYNFKKIFDELVALTKARMGDKPLDFRIHYDESIPPVLYGDNVRVKQVILNLLTNSVKYTKDGYVEFKVNSLKKDNVCRLIISVEDSGIGIKKENIEKLFTKFQRFDEKNTTIEGTGLGLAITKKLIELMNGRIVVQSIYGQGSRFTIAIDQQIVTNKTLEDIQPKTKTSFEEFDASDMKILLVDDNQLNLKVAARLLASYKPEIISIDNGFECIDKIKNGEHFDLILMDDMMPKMSGVETLQKLKELENFNIPTVALTANAIEGMREKYLEHGFDDYLSKPIDKLELNKVIHNFLNKN